MYTVALCPDLSNPLNGQVTYESTAFGVIATYTCNSRFGLSGGDDTQICGGDGSSTTGVWEGVVPTCEGMYKNLILKQFV